VSAAVFKVAVRAYHAVNGKVFAEQFLDFNIRKYVLFGPYFRMNVRTLFASGAFFKKSSYVSVTFLEKRLEIEPSIRFQNANYFFKQKLALSFFENMGYHHIEYQCL
jgi:hypothetical protein